MIPGPPAPGRLHFGGLEAEFPLEIRSNVHGRPILVDKGHYEYTCETKVVQGQGKKTYWKCRKKHKGCKVRMATLGDEIMIIKSYIS